MKVPVEKNKEYIVDIIDYGAFGEGIAKVENFTIFIPSALKGEKIKVLIVKVQSSHAFGKIVEILKKSKYRVEEDCNSYKRCGGCDLRHIDYEETLNMKQEMVQNLVNKTLSQKPKIEKTIGMGNPYHYRNKAQYPLGLDKQKNPVMGVYAQRTHEIIPISNCMIQSEISQKIANYIFNYIKENKIPVYNEKTRKGVIRHIVTRVGFRSHEVMCILVTNTDGFQKEKELTKNLVENFPEIKTIVKNINNKNTNVILGDRNINLYGDGFIFDTLGDYTFKISPNSFYQINPIQTEALYEIALEKANLSKSDILFDLYCGIGTIGIFAAKKVKKVYGIEIVEQAIEDAKENAQINEIHNIEFIAGDVEKTFETLMKKENVYPDVLVVDPPRKGLDITTIGNIIAVEPKKLIYISCNPATLVRDLKELEEKYKVKEIHPVDMFPFTHHVECVCVLELKQNTEI